LLPVVPEASNYRTSRDAKKSQGSDQHRMFLEGIIGRIVCTDTAATRLRGRSTVFSRSACHARQRLIAESIKAENRYGRDGTYYFESMSRPGDICIGIQVSVGYNDGMELTSCGGVRRVSGWYDRALETRSNNDGRNMVKPLRVMDQKRKK
jgi:hypothetical protein